MLFSIVVHQEKNLCFIRKACLHKSGVKKIFKRDKINTNATFYKLKKKNSTNITFVQDSCGEGVRLILLKN